MKELTTPGQILTAISLLVLFCATSASQDAIPAHAQSSATVNATDFPSLQSAFDALPDAGGLIRLPDATIEIREPILVRTGDVLIQGAGPASHVHNANIDGKPAFIISSERPQAKPSAKLEPLWRVQLSDFRLTGNEKSGHGIEARFVNEIFIDGITISEHGGDGVHLHMCYEDPRINDALITYNKGAGVFANGCHDTLIAACHFEENNDAIRFIDGFNLTATGNNIDDHLQHGVVIENSMGNTLSGNMIEQCAGIGVVLERDTYGTTVGSNVFTNDREGGVALRDAHGCTITGNTFSRVPKRAVSIDAKSHATTISGNTFADSSVGEGKYKGKWDLNVATGIVLDGASWINITGNTFSNLTGKALTLGDEPCRDVIFSSNLILNAPSDHAKLVDSLVHGNLERSDPAARAIELASAGRGGFAGLKEINPPASVPDDSLIAIVGATLVDGKGGPPLSQSVVVVKGNRIAGVGRRESVTIPEGAKIMDASGLTLLPGLIDSHFHIGSGSKMYEHPPLFLQSGITSARDPGRPIEVYLPICESQQPMPRLFLTGPHFDQSPPAYPHNAVILKTPEAARQAVHRYVEQGASAIKVYFRLPLDCIRATCEAARLRGIPVTAHLELVDVDEAILAGIDGFEHITSCGTVLAEPEIAAQFRSAVDDDNAARKDGRYRLWAGLDLDSSRARQLLKLIGDRKIFVSPTLAVFECRPGDKNQSQEFHVRGFENMLKFTGMCHDAGGVVVTGSHGSVSHAKAGFAFQREMELLVESGLTPLEAITASTLDNARFLGCAERLGSIEPGKLADLVLVGGQPHENIRDMYEVRHVMLGGHWVRTTDD